MPEKTQKEDRRTRYTRQVIKEAFLTLLEEKEYPKITVTEICRLAEINRGTFYLHYYDTADVLDDLLDPLDYQADGLLTNQPGLCLTIYYADCIPVLLYDPVHRAIAAVHSGWRGTSLGIAPQAVAKMTALYGSDPGDILAAIGPGIGPCCFETHDDVPSAMVQRLGEDILSHCVPLAHGKFSVDLKGIIHWQLTQAGLADGHVDTLSLCTACHPELYWSHRKMGDQRGNHAAMLQLLP